MIESIDENKVNEYLEGNKKRMGIVSVLHNLKQLKSKKLLGGEYRFSGSRWSY